MKLIVLIAYAAIIAGMTISACQRKVVAHAETITSAADSFRCEMSAMFGHLENRIEEAEKRVDAMPRRPIKRAAVIDSMYLDDFLGNGPGRMVPIRGPQQ